MLNFKNTTLLFALVFLIILILWTLQMIPFYFGWFALAIYMLIIVLGVVFIQWNFYVKSIKRLPNKKQVLLSFDDGPDPVLTPLILDILDDYQAKAIFFVIGEQAEKSPLLLKEIKRRGHIIGNHSYSHSNFFDFFSVKSMIAEVEKTNEIITKTIETKVSYFRPPFGVTNPRIAKMLNKTGMKSVAWSFRSYDGGGRSKDKIIKKMKNKMRGGDILLFHDNRNQTPDILKEALPWLVERFELKNDFLKH